MLSEMTAAIPAAQAETLRSWIKASSLDALVGRAEAREWAEQQEEERARRADSAAMMEGDGMSSIGGLVGGALPLPRRHEWRTFPSVQRLERRALAGPRPRRRRAEYFARPRPATARALTLGRRRRRPLARDVARHVFQRWLASPTLWPLLVVVRRLDLDDDAAWAGSGRASWQRRADCVTDPVQRLVARGPLWFPAAACKLASHGGGCGYRPRAASLVLVVVHDARCAATSNDEGVAAKNLASLHASLHATPILGPAADGRASAASCGMLCLLEAAEGLQACRPLDRARSRWPRRRRTRMELIMRLRLRRRARACIQMGMVMAGTGTARA